MYSRISLVGVAATFCCCVSGGVQAADDDSGIRPWPENPFYWQYRGKPVMLLGGTDDDNVFQMPDMREQLETLAAAGGNVVRNTMSDRKDHGYEVYPYARRADGKYDLNTWNDEYWRRFETMLETAEKLGIIVQIEVWDRFDYADHRPPGNWKRHPYNPVNNINYTAKESGLAASYPFHPGANKQPFFFTTPKQRNNKVVLRYQQRFVDKMLSYTLRHDNVLYCMDNETRAQAAWGAYWARYIKDKAKAAGRTVCVTEMWDDWNIRSPMHRRTFDHPELYDFVDVSQNNQNKGEKHWRNILWVRAYLKKAPRPMNTTKTYGADTGHFGTTQDGIERFWRHLLAGVASARFHRPTSGLGLSPRAQASIRAARLLEKQVAFWDLEPDNSILTDRQKNEAYAAKGPGVCVVFLTRGGSVGLKPGAVSGADTIQWISIVAGKLGPRQTVHAATGVTLKAPSAEPWVAVVKKSSAP